MNNPGLKNLGTASVADINAADSAMVITSGLDANSQTVPYIGSLDGMLGATIQANFSYGAGGTTLKVMIETSLDQGLTWIEVARLAFATASAEKVVNLSGLTPKTTPYTPVALSDDACVDGILGDRWRASIVTAGTYTGNTALSVRMVAR